MSARILGVLAGLPLLLIGTSARATGYSGTLIEKEATDFYQSILPLVTANGVRCPVGQTPRSGLVSGGGAGGEAGGADHFTIFFNKGAKLKVDKFWGGWPNRTFTVQISCSYGVDARSHDP